MESSIRRQKLKEIQENQSYLVMTGVPLSYKGDTKRVNVYKIPLEYLIYNKYNGRIGSEVKSYERQYRPLNAENETDKKYIEKLLFDSSSDRNKSTMKSLIDIKQQRHGIVTEDGVIIDGNRRAMLLNKIVSEQKNGNIPNSFENIQHCTYFLAIILPDKAEERDIQQLEATYQMGEDSKVDYNAIQKYLKCADLKRVGFENNKIAEFMGEKPQQIDKYFSILKLMEDYLESYGYQGIYTRLEKTEGPFVDLEGYIDSYKKESANAKTDWAFDESDISDLKAVCFDYIRARYEGKEFRDIGKTGRKGYASIFTSKEIWESFLQEHIDKVPIDSKTTDELRAEHEGEDFSILFKARDTDWANQATNVLVGNLKKHYNRLENKREASDPIRLLEKALDILDTVDTTQESFYKNEAVEQCVKQINKISWEMKKLLDKR